MTEGNLVFTDSTGELSIYDTDGISSDFIINEITQGHKYHDAPELCFYTYAEYKYLEARYLDFIKKGIREPGNKALFKMLKSIIANKKTRELILKIDNSSCQIWSYDSTNIEVTIPADDKEPNAVETWKYDVAVIYDIKKLVSDPELMRKGNQGIIKDVSVEDVTYLRKAKALFNIPDGAKYISPHQKDLYVWAKLYALLDQAKETEKQRDIIDEKLKQELLPRVRSNYAYGNFDKLTDAMPKIGSYSLKLAKSDNPVDANTESDRINIVSIEPTKDSPVVYQFKAEDFDFLGKPKFTDAYLLLIQAHDKIMHMKEPTNTVDITLSEFMEWRKLTDRKEASKMLEKQLNVISYMIPRRVKSDSGVIFYGTPYASSILIPGKGRAETKATIKFNQDGFEAINATKHRYPITKKIFEIRNSNIKSILIYLCQTRARNKIVTGKDGKPVRDEHGNIILQQTFTKLGVKTLLDATNLPVVKEAEHKSKDTKGKEEDKNKNKANTQVTYCEKRHANQKIIEPFYDYLEELKSREIIKSYSFKHNCRKISERIKDYDTFADSFLEVEWIEDIYDKEYFTQVPESNATKKLPKHTKKS